MTTAYSSSSAPSWTRTTVADGHKFSALRRLSRRLFDRSKKRNFTYPTFIWRPLWGRSHRDFVESFCFVELRSPWAIVQRCLRDRSSLRVAVFVELPTCDGPTRDDSKYRAIQHSVARLKTRSCTFSCTMMTMTRHLRPKRTRRRRTRWIRSVVSVWRHGVSSGLASRWRSTVTTSSASSATIRWR